VRLKVKNHIFQFLQTLILSPKTRRNITFQHKLSKMLKKTLKSGNNEQKNKYVDKALMLSLCSIKKLVSILFY